MIANSVAVKHLMNYLGQADARNTLILFSVVTVLVRCVQWLSKSYREFKHLPPGPWGLPIFGYLVFMGKEKHTRFMELAKSYGSIYSARLGYQLTVVISDYKMIREMFRKEEFTGRPDTPFLKTINGFGKIYLAVCFFSSVFGVYNSIC